MSKALTCVPGSPASVIIGDTVTYLYLQVTKDNEVVDLTTAMSITVKISDSSKNYLKDISVIPSSLPDGDKGIIAVPLGLDDIAGFPSGKYIFEVWVEASSNVMEIYPDFGTRSFTISNNIVSGTTKFTTITLQQSDDNISDIVADFESKVNSGYFKGPKGDKGDTGATGPQGPQGPKGDTGTVNNAGLTNAPAFQTLQTQVNNSAVGTNLLTGTSSSLQTKQFTNSWNPGPQAINGNYQIKLAKGQTYTYRAWIDNTNGLDNAFVNVRFKPIGGTDFDLGEGTPIVQGKTGYSTVSITPLGDGYAWFTPFAYSSQKTFLAKWKEEKLELGSVATAWCPNPSEILTQSDYAKIKAAIVALGGSLS